MVTSKVPVLATALSLILCTTAANAKPVVVIRSDTVSGVCAVSFNGGVLKPLPDSRVPCDVSVEYGPQGQLYVAYKAQSQNPEIWATDILLAKSLDKGKTWWPPVLALEGTEAESFVLPRLAVSPDGWLYVLGTMLGLEGPDTGLAMSKSLAGASFVRLSATGAPPGFVAWGNISRSAVIGGEVVGGALGQVEVFVRRQLNEEACYTVEQLRSINRGLSFERTTLVPATCDEEKLILHEVAGARRGTAVVLR